MSGKLLAETLRVTPGGSQTRSKAPGRMGPPNPDGKGAYPLYASSANGAYVVDDRGRRYLDCFGANAAVTLGYNRVNNEPAGCLLPLPWEQEGPISRKFLAACAPWAEQVRWVKTGSEAVSAAVRLARIATGRAAVLMFSDSYHGWHDTSYARFRDTHPVAGADVYANGVPACLGDTVRLMPYGADPSNFLARDLAAVVIEAARFDHTDVDWLRGLQVAADACGAKVIFDEMVYGMRWAKGGAVQFFGLPAPDLSCFGKALGNGAPIACVCGSAQAMGPAADFVSGTFGGDASSLAIASQVLDAYAHTDVIGRLWEKGQILRGGFDEAGAVHAFMEHYPVHWRLVMPTPAGMDQVLEALAVEGVLMHRGSNNISIAMSDFECRAAGALIGRLARKYETA